MSDKNNSKEQDAAAKPAVPGKPVEAGAKSDLNQKPGEPSKPQAAKTTT